jgi:hypothetical protein
MAFINNLLNSNPLVDSATSDDEKPTSGLVYVELQSMLFWIGSHFSVFWSPNRALVSRPSSLRAPLQAYSDEDGVAQCRRQAEVAAVLPTAAGERQPALPEGAPIERAGYQGMLGYDGDEWTWNLLVCLSICFH